MFGMGTQMKIADFAGVLKMPWGVLVGVAGQFTVMPLVGYSLTRVFAFEAEVAAGIVLIGCCSSGLASNVMTYMARANLALSITMTAITTVLAPLVTPLWMKLLAGQLIEVRVLSMMLEITKLVLVPVIAGLLHDFLVTAPSRWRQVGWSLVSLSAIGIMAFALLLMSRGSVTASTISPWQEVLAYLAGALLAGAAFHGTIRLLPQIQIAMPLLSMIGIVIVVGIITAAGRDELMKVGGLLCLAAVLHNLLGYALGYGLARLCQLDKSSARTIAFEVGMQNGGMASGIANMLGRIGTMGLAPAIFAAWMSVSGSLLANYWRKRP
jgi:BASS family bile acid:Na+ symporter